MKTLLVTVLLTATAVCGDIINERVRKKIPECTMYTPRHTLVNEYVKARRSKTRVIREVDEVLDLIKLVSDPTVRKQASRLIDKALLRASENGFKKPLKVYFMETLLCKN